MYLTCRKIIVAIGINVCENNKRIIDILYVMLRRDITFDIALEKSGNYRKKLFFKILLYRKILILANDNILVHRLVIIFVWI